MAVWLRAPLLVRAWDDETVVYHRESGDTHLVDGLTAHVLQCLEITPLGEADIAACLDVEPGPELTALLTRLEASGLIACRAL